MKLPSSGIYFQAERGSFIQKFYLIFGIPEFRSISEPRECQAEGVSLLSMKLSVCRELRRLQGELQSEKIPAVISIPKIGTILKSREFQFRGVSK